MADQSGTKQAEEAKIKADTKAKAAMESTFKSLQMPNTTDNSTGPLDPTIEKCNVSPFPVLFSAATATPYPNTMANQTMHIPGLVGMIPGASSGSSGGVVLSGAGLSLGEVCKEHLTNGRCLREDCELSHPPQGELMAALEKMGIFGEAPVSPAAMVAALAWQQLQDHAAGEGPGSPDEATKADSTNSLPLMMQQAVAIQKMQIQRALNAQEAMQSQRAATQATMQSAIEAAAARAAEISNKLKAEGLTAADEEINRKESSL